MKDWDDAFANMAHIPGSDALPEKWTAKAKAYRESGLRIEEHAYGTHPRERFDLVWPDATPKGLAVFIHGGYWIRLDKSYWTDLAEGARANGWVVCMVQYALAPEVRISQITQQIGQAIKTAAQIVEGPIHVAGHSAGGHLAARMVCEDTPLPETVRDRLQHILAISGLHDLRPLMNTQMNEQLRIDEAEAKQESAALRRPVPSARLTAWVGGGERPEFIRQTQLLALMWEGFDIPIRSVIEGTHDHFTVLDDLKDPNSAISQAFVGKPALKDAQ